MLFGILGFAAAGDTADAGVDPANVGDGIGSPQVADRQPATDAARKVLDTLARVERQLTETRYDHTTRVDEHRGIFTWDCSTMAEWVLRRAAPNARSALPGTRPLARDFYEVIRHSSTQSGQNGWIRLTSPEQIAPGDVFAWIKPAFWRRHNNTGHVGFVVSTPRPSAEAAGIWFMKVADATGLSHGEDSRPPEGNGGYGTGTVAFQFDEKGNPFAYGWYGQGQPADTFVPTGIVFGRVTK